MRPPEVQRGRRGRDVGDRGDLAQAAGDEPLAKPAAVVVTVSPSLAPTWNVKPVAPKSVLAVERCVVASTMFLISAAI